MLNSTVGMASTKRTQEQDVSARHSMSTASGEPTTKHQKTETQGDTRDKRVVRSKLQTWQGILSAEKYERVCQERCSIDDILKEIDIKTSLEISCKKFFLFGAFRAALKDLLTEIDARECEIYLIHGMSGVGKTALATCLAHYLALEGGTSTLVKMDGKQLNNETALTSLCQYFEESRWLIYDQCNLNNLQGKEVDFERDVYNRNAEPEYEKPVIMFTSEHYSPQESWDNDENMVKIINMEIDGSGVECLKNDIRLKVDVNYEDVLSVSKRVWHALQCLKTLKKPCGVDVRCDRESLIESVFKSSHMDILRKNCHIFLLFLPELCALKPEEMVRLVPSHYKLHPDEEQLLNLLLTTTDGKLDSHWVANWLEIDGEKEKELDGYIVYRRDAHFFCFSHLKKLVSLLNGALAMCTPQRLFQSYLDVNGMVDRFEEADSMKGRLFANVVQLACELKSCKSKSSKYGLHIYTHYKFIAYHEVEITRHICNVEGLCEVAEQFFNEERSYEKESAMWCVLNQHGKPEFPGYDYAFIHTLRGVNIVQLLQTTDAARLNRVCQMTDVVTQVMKKLKDTCTSARVTGYFVVPEGFSKCKKVDQFDVVEFRFSDRTT